jgi:MraZ protein
MGNLEQMFLGEYTHTLDDKGRLTLPAKYRAELAMGLVVTRGIDKCLFVFPMPEWQTLSGKLSALPLTDPQAREFQRLIFSGANDTELDKQGRVLLPQYLRDYAGLDGNVIVAGLNTHLEIWAPDAWNTIRANFDSGISAEYWSKLGI